MCALEEKGKGTKRDKKRIKREKRDNEGEKNKYGEKGIKTEK